MPGSLDWTCRFDEAISRLVVEERGVRLGRMEVLENPPHEHVLVHPRVEPGRDPLDVAGALVGAGLRRAAEARVRNARLLLVDKSPHADAFGGAANGWGFDLEVAKTLMRAAKDALRLGAVPPAPAGAAFVAGDPEMPDALGRILATSSSPSDRCEVPRDFLASCESRCRRDDCFFPEDWALLRIDGAAAGVVLPAFVEAERQACTNLYVGVVPEFRGRGLGGVLVRRGVDTMLARGATRYIGSCDVCNAPMRRIFERIGCTPVTTQRMYLRRLAPCVA